MNNTNFWKSLLLIFIMSINACDNHSKTNKNTNSDVEDLTLKIKEKPKDAALYYTRGLVYKKIKNDSLAVLDFIKAIELDTTKANYYSAAAEILFDKKDVRSIPYIQKALQLNPNDVKAHLKIATMQFYSKNYPETFKSINTVLRTDVYNYDAYFLKGMCYKEMGDTVSAINSFQTASRINPENAEPYMQLAFLNTNKDSKQAVLYFENAFKADTNNVEPLNGIGIIYQNKKDNNNAKKAFIRCIEQQPGFAKAYYNIGCILMDEDSLEKAKRQFDIATKNNPQYVEAYYNRGLCNLLLNNKTNALQDFDQALQINPDFTLAIEAKKKMNK